VRSLGLKRNSKRELEGKLHGASPVRVEGMQETVPRVAIGARAAGRRVIRIRAGIATDGIAGRIALRGIVDAEPGVIEDVECLGAELEIDLVRQREVLKQGHIEVSPPGIVQYVAAGIAKGEAAWCGEGRGIQKQRAKALWIVASGLLRIGDAVSGTADKIRIGLVERRQPVGDSRIAQGCVASSAGVIDTEWNAGLHESQPG
jgi:hypothetical protein